MLVLSEKTPMGRVLSLPRNRRSMALVVTYCLAEIRISELEAGEQIIKIIL